MYTVSGQLANRSQSKIDISIDTSGGENGGDTIVVDMGEQSVPGPTKRGGPVRGAAAGSDGEGPESKRGRE